MWRTLFDSVIGSSHVQQEIPCQDACRVAKVGAGDSLTLIIACSDGAGSAANSDIGSRAACDEFVRIIEEAIASGLRCREITREQMEAWYTTVRERLLAEAELLGVSPSELACTLLVTVIDADSAAYGQVGDGCIVVGSPGNLKTVFWPQSGEYANTTNFIVNPNLTQLLEFHTSEAPEECAVFTDGIERLVLKFADKTVHEPFLRPFFNALKLSPDVDVLFAKLREFLESKPINDRTDDDKTLILVLKESNGSVCQ